MQAALESARAHGFLGEGPVATHIAHALGFAEAIERALGTAPAGFLDLGSGGGLPGLVLAGHWPAARAVFLDANHRRSQALQRAVDQLGWQERVRVRCLRAEEAGRNPELRASQPVVVARSFGPPAVTAECAAPLLEVDGLLVVSEPPVGSEGLVRSGCRDRWPPGPLAELGLLPLRFWAGEFGYQVLRQVRLCPHRFPRRSGIPAKRPLF